MKALLQTGYGVPQSLSPGEIEKPRIGDKQVLVRVHAASVNALDCHLTRGMPYFMRIGGLRTPRDRIRGVDLSGQVEAVGSKVVGLKPGDEVFGGGDGSFAEYAATTPDRLAVKSAGVTHEQAATLNIAGLTALQGLRDVARLRPGQRVLVNGAGGGVGTFAVQIARWLGAFVTATTRTEHVEMVGSIGANEVIDYRTEDFATRATRYDVLFDIGGNRSFRDCRHALTAKGTLVIVGAPAGRWLAPATRLLLGMGLSPLVSQRIVPFVAKSRSADLALLEDLVADGTLRPIIDREYTLDDAAQAVAHVESGRARGKVAIRVR